MRVSDCVGCTKFPCTDVKHECYVVPKADVRLRDISIILISEAAPPNPDDYYYARGKPLFQQTTVQAFNDAGAEVKSIQDIVDLGVSLTTAVKCAKTGYGVKASTVEECSFILEKELALFPNAKVLLLMGDVAIKAVNYIAKRAGGGRVIPAGSTYKIQGQKYLFRGKRVFPSYLQAGPGTFARQVFWEERDAHSAYIV